jgi:hypothetical protein
LKKSSKKNAQDQAVKKAKKNPHESQQKKTAGTHLLDFSPPLVSLPVASTLDAWTAAELQQRTRHQKKGWEGRAFL